MVREGFSIDRKKDTFNPLEETTPAPESEKIAAGEIQGLLDSHTRFFETLAGDTSLQFKASDHFSIDLKKGIVNLASDWFVKQGYSRSEIIWAISHEIAHFRDLAADPNRMMENFEYIGKKAKETGAIIAQRYEAETGERADPQSAEHAAHRIHHTFYNIFDDVFVNNAVARRAPRYERGTEGGNAIADLYRNKLFPESDYTKLPRHLQFLYAILRDEMVTDESVSISEEVREILERPVRHERNTYTARELVEKFLKPQSIADTKAGNRYALLRKLIEPQFEDLLKRDINDWKPEKQSPMQRMLSRNKGKGNDPFKGEYDKFDERNPDQFSEGEVEKWVKNEEVEAQKKETPHKDEAQERAKEAQKKMDEEWCKKEKVRRDQLQEFRGIEHSIAPYLVELSALWQRIVYGQSRGTNRQIKSGFRSGVDLDINRVVQEWPEIVHGQGSEAHVMRRMTTLEAMIQQPEVIRLRILADVSGSMNDDVKLPVLRQTVALLLSSLHEFQTHLNRSRSVTKTKMHVETEVWTFGHRAMLVKPRSGAPGEGERAAMIRTVMGLDADEADTRDYLGLEKIRRSLAQSEKQSIADKKTLDIVFLITDGGSGDPQIARQELDQLLEQGVVVRGFQIGDVMSMEKESFTNVWNRGRQQPLGEIVGGKVATLVPAVARTLAAYMENVKL